MCVCVERARAVAADVQYRLQSVCNNKYSDASSSTRSVCVFCHHADYGLANRQDQDQHIIVQ